MYTLQTKDWVQVIIICTLMVAFLFGLGYMTGSQITESRMEMASLSSINHDTNEERDFGEEMLNDMHIRIGYGWGYVQGSCEALFKCDPDAFKKVNCLKTIKNLRPIILRYEPNAKLNPDLQKELDND